MECRNCKSKIDDKSIYCPYCGEKVSEDTGYIDPFAEYRLDNSHEKQYQYQHNYSKSEQDSDLSKVKESSFLSPKAYSWIGLLLSIASIFCCFIHIGVGICVLVVSIFLIVSGFRHAKVGMRIGSIVGLIFSIIMVIVVSIIIWVLSLTIILENGMKYTIKDYLVSMFFNTLYSDKVYGIWIDNSKEVLDLTYSNYYRLYDQEGKISSEGTYQRVEGHKVGVEDMMYSDHEFYFFDFVPGYSSSYNYEEIILCLDKDDFSRMILYFPEKDYSVEMKRISSLPYSSWKSSTKNPIPEIIG